MRAASLLSCEAVASPTQRSSSGTASVAITPIKLSAPVAGGAPDRSATNAAKASTRVAISVT
eukprot:3691751-Prymnesium_polylepis.1